MIFEEVGNRNFFFRTDVVEYKSKTEIIGYELKLKDFKKLIQQVIYTISVYDKSYMVIPISEKEKLLNEIKLCSDKRIEKIGIIAMDKNKYKIIKSIKESTRDIKINGIQH